MPVPTFYDWWGFHPYGANGSRRCPPGHRREVIHGHKTHRCIDVRPNAPPLSEYPGPAFYPSGIERDDWWDWWGDFNHIPQDILADLARTYAEIQAITVIPRPNPQTNPAGSQLLRECEQLLQQCIEDLRACEEKEDADNERYTQRDIQLRSEKQRCQDEMRAKNQIMNDHRSTANSLDNRIRILRRIVDQHMDTCVLLGNA